MLRYHVTRHWVANKDLGWTWTSNFTELANFIFCRTCELHRTFRKMKAFFRKMLHFGKIPKKFGLNLAKFVKILGKNFNVQNLQNFAKQNSKNFSNFWQKLRLDLGESFPTSTYLQNLASIEPRTSPNKFASSSSRKFWTWTLKFQSSYLQPRDMSKPDQASAALLNKAQT